MAAQWESLTIAPSVVLMVVRSVEHLAETMGSCLVDLKEQNLADWKVAMTAVRMGKPTGESSVYMSVAQSGVMKEATRAVRKVMKKGEMKGN